MTSSCRASIAGRILLRRTAGATLFVALLVIGLVVAAYAGPQQPNITGAVPMSWVQFKQQFGVLDTTNNNALALPGTPTAIFGSAQDSTGGEAGTLQFGQQIEGWLLGDSKTETPIPQNFMRDVNAVLGPNAVENWL